MTHNESLLRFLATVPASSALQLATVLNTSLQVSRRCIRWGLGRGYLKAQSGFGERGRPVQLIRLRSQRGNANLHDWQVTEFLVRLIVALRDQDDVKVAALRNPKNGGPLLPDLVLSLTCASKQKSLLFFLELDRATEPIRRQTEGSDFGSKLRRYRHLRISHGYRSFAPGANPKGFRVLVVTPSEARSTEILRAIETDAGGDFVWVTEWPTLNHTCITGEVWRQREGGNCRSIFGSIAKKVAERERASGQAQLPEGVEDLVPEKANHECNI